MDLDWKNWKTYASLFLILFSIYSFVKTVLIIIRGLSYDPNNFDSSRLQIVTGPALGIFSLEFALSVIVALLFIVLAISLWKNYSKGILIGTIPFLWWTYQYIYSIIKYRILELIYLPERFIEVIWEFVIFSLYHIFYIVSIIYLIYLYKKLKKPVEVISPKNNKSKN